MDVLVGGLMMGPCLRTLGALGTTGFVVDSLGWTPVGWWGSNLLSEAFLHQVGMPPSGV